MNADWLTLLGRQLPSQWVDESLRVVTDTAQHTANSDDRREVAVVILRRTLHVPEFIARCLIEIAWLLVKTKGLDRAVEKDDERA